MLVHIQNDTYYTTFMVVFSSFRNLQKKMESISYHLAASRISKELLQEIIYSIVCEGDNSEELKLKIIKVIK